MFGTSPPFYPAFQGHDGYKQPRTTPYGGVGFGLQGGGMGQQMGGQNGMSVHPWMVMGFGENAGQNIAQPFQNNLGRAHGLVMS